MFPASRGATSTTRRPSTYAPNVTRKEYEKYLESEHWQRVRYAVLRDAGGRCARCGRGARHVHHLTYERLWHERPGDTEALCERCHAEAHGNEWPPVIASREETRDGKPFVVKVLKPAGEPPQTRQRNTTHRRPRRNIR